MILVRAFLRFTTCSTLFAATSLSSLAQITPDGGTATSVTIGSGGRPIIGIAPTSGSVSHNTYSAFSVGPVGAALDNTGVRATLIVNQVTSSNRSLIEGPVEVLGSRAHVVLANPNGITVNGGSFINTGGVVLSGGTVRYDGSGNPVVPAGPGDILVGPNGLGGVMSTLQLVAARIRIDGPVVNEHVSPNADISLLVGNSELTLDAGAAPSSTLQPLVKSRADLGSASADYLVDVTPNGFLSASRVNIAVSAKGAGVNFNGAGYSTVGAFTISASGKISSRGAYIKGESGVKLAGGSVEILNSPERTGLVVSNAGPVIILASSGNIDLMGQIVGIRQGSDPDAQGAVTLKASGDINIFSENKDKLAIAYGEAGDLVIDAGGNIVNNGGRLLSNGTIRIHAGGTLNNLTEVVDTIDNGGPQVEIRKKRFWLSWIFGKKKHVVTTFDYGRLRLPGERSLIFGANVEIDAGTVINSGEISAADGSLVIRANDVFNLGVWTGTASYEKRCGIFCKAWGESNINVTGGVMQSQYGLSITAANQVINNGGQIVAYGNLEITAPKVESIAAFVMSVINRPAGLGNFWTGPRAWIGYQPLGGYILAPLGTVTINSDASVVNDGGWIEGGVATIVPGGINELRNNKPVGPDPKRRIGLFHDLIP